MKTLIIPSDFTTKSIEMAEAIVSGSKEETRIIFIHLFHVADDIQDLLFSNYRKREYDFVSEEFWKACNLLKSLYPEVLKSTKVEFFYGNKLAHFKNFLEYNQADEMVYSKSYGIPKISKSSIDALPVIMKCGLPLIDADAVMEPAMQDEVQHA